MLEQMSDEHRFHLTAKIGQDVSTHWDPEGAGLGGEGLENKAVWAACNITTCPVASWK